VRVRFHGRTDLGRKRATNQDAFVASDDYGYCVLCDGMGGHSSGEIASRMAVEILEEKLRNELPDFASERSTAADQPMKTSLSDLVERWLVAANSAIYERSSAEPSLRAHGRRMGTTVALLLIVEDFALVAHVGDSRVYRLRGREIELLTRDHSVLTPEGPSAVGIAAPMAAAGRRKRKYVTRALGTRRTVLPDILIADIRPGDHFLLCSDGLTDGVSDAEIAAAILERTDEPQNVPTALINLANERGGRDNITVVLASLEPGEAGVARRARPTIEPPARPRARLVGEVRSGDGAPCAGGLGHAVEAGPAGNGERCEPADRVESVAERRVAPVAEGLAVGADAQEAVPPPLEPPPPWEAEDRP